jgi:putative CocE/NonD family hydrolase
MDAVPVDQDHDRSMLSAAVAQHVGNHHVGNIFKSMPYRNSWSEETNSLFWFESSATSYHDQIERWGGGIYHRGGWYDGLKGDMILSFVNMQNPGKLLLGPWQHCETKSEFEFDLEAEYRRWYDFWLKGIDNGIMTEPPIYYYTMGAPEGQAWRFAQEWPLPNEKPTKFFFNTGRSGSVNSINDGTLTIQPPEAGTYPNLYTDVSCLLWINPTCKRHGRAFLAKAKEDGFLDRVMFGSDQIRHPNAIGMSIEYLNSLEFLSEQDKRDILYNNAARFLRLDEESQD